MAAVLTHPTRQEAASTYMISMRMCDKRKSLTGTRSYWRTIYGSVTCCCGSDMWMHGLLVKRTCWSWVVKPRQYNNTHHSSCKQAGVQLKRWHRARKQNGTTVVALTSSLSTSLAHCTWSLDPSRCSAMRKKQQRRYSPVTTSVLFSLD